MVHLNPADTTRRNAINFGEDERRTGHDRRLDSRRGERTIEFEDGDYIFREQETGDSAFIVKSGRVEIVKSASSGEAVMASLKPGELFGEMALIDNQPRMASARAADGPVTLYVLSQTELDLQVDACPRFVQKLLKLLTSHARKAGDLTI
ncbi:MAG: cyclic nucleotide-binding domain-containing protein [Proteobacteria bacterium]|nr:cyclic nucleotide-binding domain-containing protein [Pseudomonadota bacterium]